MLCDESATLEDRHIMDELTEKIEKARDNIVLDERFGGDAVDEDDDAQEHSADDMSVDAECDAVSASAVQRPLHGSRHTHHHTTLKQSVPTRWNATLIMVESMLDNETQVNRALLQTGNRELIDDLCYWKSTAARYTSLPEAFRELYEACEWKSATSRPNYPN